MHALFLPCRRCSDINKVGLEVRVVLRLLEGNVEVDLSVAPMLLYRTTRFDDTRGSAPLKLIPVVMPLLSVEHRSSGIGANLTVLPGGNFGKDLQFPGLVFLQFTYR